MLKSTARSGRKEGETQELGREIRKKSKLKGMKERRLSAGVQRKIGRAMR